MGTGCRAADNIPEGAIGAELRAGAPLPQIAARATAVWGAARGGHGLKEWRAARARRLGLGWAGGWESPARRLRWQGNGSYRSAGRGSVGRESPYVLFIDGIRRPSAASISATHTAARCLPQVEEAMHGEREGTWAMDKERPRHTYGPTRRIAAADLHTRGRHGRHVLFAPRSLPRLHADDGAITQPPPGVVRQLDRRQLSR